MTYRLQPITIPNWSEDAACVGIHDAFFPEQGHPATPALRVCRRCPVRAECLEVALANKEDDGIWGGTTPRQRRAIRKGRAA